MPLIEHLLKDLPTLYQPWCADDEAAGGKFNDLQKFIDYLALYSPEYGYFPEPQKIILLVHNSNLKSAKESYGKAIGKIQTCNCYLGSNIGKCEEKEKWIKDKVDTWLHKIS